MDQYINEYGKPVWQGATEETPFSSDLFHDVPCIGDDRQIALHTNIGSLTVLDRMTGYGWRDIETGYRDIDGNFWLASGGHDVSRSSAKTLGEAIDWVKIRANTCVPDRAKKSKESED